MGNTFRTGKLINGLYVDDNGNVGIGTTTMSDRLTISGNTTVLGSINISSYLNFTSIYGGVINGYTGTTSVPMSYSASQHTFNTGGTARLFINSSGNVGIGTSSPAYLLSVYNNASISVPLLDVSNAGTYGLIGVRRGVQSASAGINFYTTTVQKWFAGIFENTDNFGFYNTALNNFPLVITTGGNVGIGTSSPGVLFEAYKTGGSAVIRANYNGTTTFDLTASSGGNAYLSTSNNAMIFETNSTERMRITSGGQVGIGTSSPQRTFVVARSNGQGIELDNQPGYSTILSYNRTTGTYTPLTMGEGSTNVLIGTTTDTGWKLNVNGTIYSSAIIAFGTTTEMYLGKGNSITGALNSNDFAMMNFQSGGRTFISNATTGVYLANGSTSWSTFSDERLKNINYKIENAIDKLLNIRAVNYSWKSDKTNKENFGLIAQDIEKVLPQVIDKSKSLDINDETEYLSVRYTELIPVLVKAIQELKAEIEILKNK